MRQALNNPPQVEAMSVYSLQGAQAGPYDHVERTRCEQEERERETKPLSSVCELLQDVVTRGGKFLFLYKRPGHRVILNGVGQMMVSPSSIEASLHQSPGGTLKLVNITGHISSLMSVHFHSFLIIVKVIIVFSVSDMRCNATCKKMGITA